ncbi:uncharacterized protein KQ657_000907 [Scheffersomyces spartinae]|uniref:FAD dependent oxidoreductase domain-containing protein n=1 Tax=Scheffersomyces spartinae TaxID=45513 RepID=A0A9P8AHU3_9ASCO|nr:uncharacterized protein KQ657_000907 [Scheffersomyces spartinae]KAG7193153.1 hypothetical protein KQ657_000907 [Scheffersomyces spartinae]
MHTPSLKVTINNIMSSKDPLQIVIVGGGILGLSAALVISEKLRINHQISVIAEYLPTGDSYTAEFTSAWAGAHFRPFPSRDGNDERMMQLTRITQCYFRQLALVAPNLTIKFIRAEEYLENPDHYYTETKYGYSEEMSEFEVLDLNKAPHAFAEDAWGTKYEAWVLDAPMYLNYLYRLLRNRYGVTFIRSKLASLKQVTEHITGTQVIINCSGMGLQYDGGYDETCFPIRGQTLLVSPPANLKEEVTITRQHSNGMWTFCIPRPNNGGWIVGGTKQVGETDPLPREEDTKALIERGSKFFPFLLKSDNQGNKNLDIIRINVGFRPARKNGLHLSLDQSHDIPVIHNYGAGGMGYELSYGAATKVYELLGTLLHQSKL